MHNDISIQYKFLCNSLVHCTVMETVAMAVTTAQCTDCDVTSYKPSPPRTTYL